LEIDFLKSSEIELGLTFWKQIEIELEIDFLKSSEIELGLTF